MPSRPLVLRGDHESCKSDQFEVVQSKRNNQVVANAMDFTAKRIYMATAGLFQGLNKTWGHFFQICW